MATYLIGYDLNKEGAEYTAANKRLRDKLGAMFPTYWRNLDSTWIVVTDMTAVQIRDALRPFIDADDELLVLKSGREAAWTGFSQSASDWLKNNL